MTRDYTFAPDTRNAADTKAWVLALADAALDAPVHFGWLALAKEPKRFLWVLLSRGLLLWFAKEHEPQADRRVLMRAASGFMRLVDYTAKAVADTSLLIADSAVDCHGQPSARSAVFVARSAEERDQWLAWCDAERGRHLRRVAKGSEHYGFGRVGTKSVLLVLSHGRLAWYRKIDDAEARGSVQVEEYEFRREMGARGGAVFSVRNPRKADESYEVTAPSEAAASLWLERLASARERALKKRMVSADELRAAFVNGRAKVAKQGWLLVQGRRRYVQLRDSALVWFAHDAAPTDAAPGELKGSVLLVDSAVSRTLMSFSVRAASHKTHVFEAASEEECAAWVAALDAASEQERGAAYAHRVGAAVVPSTVAAKQGWVLIKGKRRLLDLDAGRLLLLDEALAIKRVVPLLACTAARVPPAAFLLTSLDISYVCACRDAAEAEAWVAAISLHVIRANAAAIETLDKSGWLLLDGKSRWCAIRGGALHWFSAAHAPDFVPEPRHCLPLAGARVAMVAGDKSADRTAFDLLPPPVPPGAAPWWAARKFRIRTANESDAQAWAAALSRPAAPASRDSALQSPVLVAPGCAAALRSIDPTLVGAVLTRTATRHSTVGQRRWSRVPAGVFFERQPSTRMRSLPLVPRGMLLFETSCWSTTRRNASGTVLAVPW